MTDIEDCQGRTPDQPGFSGCCEDGGMACECRPPIIPGKNEYSGDEFTDAVDRVFNQNNALLLRKHADYGPKNISQSPGGPLNGLRVRMWDKLARINNLIDSGVDPTNESLEDSFKDLCNYAVIGQLVLRGEWPE